VKSGKSFVSEAEPGSAVISSVGCVERGSEQFAKAVEACDARPSQLRVWDAVVCKRCADVDGCDGDVVTEAEKQFIGGRGLFGDAEVWEFEERLSRRVSHDGGGVKRWGKGKGFRATNRELNKTLGMCKATGRVGPRGKPGDHPRDGGAERHSLWLMMMTGPCDAAERKLSNEGAIKKFCRPGKDRT
jgi:hypothetical protein